MQHLVVKHPEQFNPLVIRFIEAHHWPVRMFGTG
jgi:hypothetical protein